ncbi:MAG: flavodoxin [Eubacteriales bacterium]|nr:flavodoxin [Eubacteriales bacterium]
MMKVAVVYWSSTGNTEKMAEAVAAGAKENGASVEMFTPDSFNASKVAEFDAIAFGCPAMGNEVLEESEFDPMFTDLENALNAKNIVLFGSYDWGDGEWMREWEERCRQNGANLLANGLIANLEPDDEALEGCKKLGALIAK